jgi:tRNA(Ile)-lysidine synthase
MLARLLQQVSSLSPRRLIIAYSGGVDSQVLLHLLASLKNSETEFPDLLAVHINHGLQSEADDWQTFCQQQCDDLGIAFIAEKISIKNTTNLEASARKLRYNAFAQLVEEGDAVVLAHHGNDQAETLLYRLFRGAGVKGMAAMKPVVFRQNMQLFRPLLEFSKEDIFNYAKQHQLAWVEDGSNQNTEFDRNFIRQQLMPVINKRWPKALERITLTASYCAEADELLNDLARLDLANCIATGVSCVDRNNAQPRCLNLAALELLTEARQKNLLRYWLLGEAVSINEQQLKELMETVIEAKGDAEPELCLQTLNEQDEQQESVCIRRFKKQLYLLSSSESAFCFTDVVRWHSNKPCEIKGLGRFVLLTNRSKPQNENQSEQQHKALTLELRPRVGGERIRLIGSVQSKSLKNWYQEQGIPPWQRQQLPLIYHDNELIAVGDVLITQQGKELLGENSIVLKKPEPDQ